MQGKTGLQSLSPLGLCDSVDKLDFLRNVQEFQSDIALYPTEDIHLPQSRLEPETPIPWAAPPPLPQTMEPGDEDEHEVETKQRTHQGRLVALRKETLRWTDEGDLAKRTEVGSLLGGAKTYRLRLDDVLWEMLRKGMSLPPGNWENMSETFMKRMELFLLQLWNRGTTDPLRQEAKGRWKRHRGLDVREIYMVLYVEGKENCRRWSLSEANEADMVEDIRVLTGLRDSHVYPMNVADGANSWHTTLAAFGEAFRSGQSEPEISVHVEEDPEEVWLYKFRALPEDVQTIGAEFVFAKCSCGDLGWHIHSIVESLWQRSTNRLGHHTIANFLLLWC